MWIRTRPASDWGGKQKWSYREKAAVADKYWKDKQEHNPELLLADVQYWWDTWVPLHPPKKQKILVERQCFGAIRTTWLESPDDYDFFNLYAMKNKIDWSFRSTIILLNILLRVVQNFWC